MGGPFEPPEGHPLVALAQFVLFPGPADLIRALHAQVFFFKKCTGSNLAEHPHEVFVPNCFLFFLLFLRNGDKAAKKLLFNQKHMQIDLDCLPSTHDHQVVHSDLRVVVM